MKNWSSCQYLVTLNRIGNDCRRGLETDRAFCPLCFRTHPSGRHPEDALAVTWGVHKDQSEIRFPLTEDLLYGFEGST